MKTKTLAILLLSILILTASGCSQEVIFADIAREIELDDPAIIGNIYSIVPLAGKLYVQNGYIYKKDNISTEHGWSIIASPENCGSIIRLASDDSFLYAMNNSYTVWAKSAATLTTEGGWTQVADNVTELFDNQITDATCNTTGRKAYITVTSAIQGDANNINQTVKELVGTGTPVAVSSSAVASVVAKSAYVKAAVYDGTTTIFSSNAAICVSGTTLYAIDSNDSVNNKAVKYKTAGGSWQNGGSVSDTPTCICAYGTDKLLVGTANGYEICTINSSTKAPSAGANSTTNAESLIGNKRRIITIKAFGPANNQSVFAGVINDNSSEYSKLWGWFGDSWNYE